MSDIKARLNDRMKAALKAGDKSVLQFARNAINAIRKKEIDERVMLDDAGVIKILAAQIKQRRESVEQFKAGGREDLVAEESAEVKFLEEYLPQQMSESEVKAIIDAAIAEVKPTGPKDMGKVMQIVLAKAAGRADGKQVSQWVKEKLS